jgi:hypothetical protein
MLQTVASLTIIICGRKTSLLQVTGNKKVRAKRLQYQTEAKKIVLICKEGV